MTIGDAKRLFFQVKKNQHVTQRTIETYEEILDRFFKFLYNEKGIVNVEMITNIDIMDFFENLDKAGLRAVTQHRFFRGLRTFFKFMLGNEYIQKYPLKGFIPPIIPNKPMRTFTAQEIATMMHCYKLDNFGGIRNYTILNLLFATGIRKVECINIKMDDINMDNDVIRIYGKGQKIRIVPMGMKMKKILQDYIKAREKHLGFQLKSDYLFIAIPRPPARKLSEGGMAIIFRNLKKKTGLKGERVSCHTFRHTFAKTYLMNGGDIFSLQKIMGHADIATTRLYLNLNNREVISQHRQFNPLDNQSWLF